MTINLYYAHSKQIYFTDIEKRELLQVIKKFPNAEIFNPSKLFKTEFGWHSFMTREFPKMDLVVFTLYQGFIGKGVYDEIQTANKLKIPVKFMTPDGNITSTFRLSNPDPFSFIYYSEIHWVN